MTPTDTLYPKMSFRLPGYLVEQIKIAASANGISMSEIIRESLENYMVATLLSNNNLVGQKQSEIHDLP